MSGERASPAAVRAAPRRRPTVRVLLVDERDRVLLLQGRISPDLPAFWFAVGGGVEPGESYRQAAVREVAEETGLLNAPVGPEIWRRARLLEIGGETWDMRERWFLARVRGFRPDTTRHSSWEQAHVGALRWWGAADLAGTPDRVDPADLGVRVAALLATDPLDPRAFAVARGRLP